MRTVTDTSDSPMDNPRPISFNSARFLTSAARLDQCPSDEGVEIAFAGRSNSGKSSAINTLTANSKLARTSKTPGRTRLINFFSLNRPGARLVDLPGYGYAKVTRELKEEWQEHLEDYLLHRQSLQGLVLITDIRRSIGDFDRMMLDWCEHNQLPLTLLATKADKLKSGQAKRALNTMRGELAGHGCVQNVILFSAMKKTGLDQTRKVLASWLDEIEPWAP